MGAVPYFYFVKYQSDIDTALQELRYNEFMAGRYNPVVSFPEFPVDSDSSCLGAGHSSIQEAIDAADADGTRSILDLKFAIAKEKNTLSAGLTNDIGYSVAIPLDDEFIEELYGTRKPEHWMIEDNMDFFDFIDRGQGIYIIVYKNDEPYEIFFEGYSYD